MMTVAKCVDHTITVESFRFKWQNCNPFWGSVITDNLRTTLRITPYPTLMLMSANGFYIQLSESRDIWMLIYILKSEERKLLTRTHQKYKLNKNNE